MLSSVELIFVYFIVYELMCVVINIIVLSFDIIIKKLEKSGFYWGVISVLKVKVLL